MSKKIIIIGIIIILLIIALIFLGWFRKNKNLQKSNLIEEATNNAVKMPILNLETQNNNLNNTNTFNSQAKKQINLQKEKKLLFKNNLMYIDLDYPIIYVYDPEKQVIKYINLEDETYREIAQISDFQNGWLSEDKTKIIVKTNENFILIDLTKDNISNLPPMTKNFIFTPDLWLYLNIETISSYLAKFNNDNIAIIRYLGILNPEFAALKNGILIYEKYSPLFFLSFQNTDNLNLFLEDKIFDILVNKDKNLILVIYKDDQELKSKIINLDKKIEYEFNWITNKEKCSFDELLICAISSNFDPESWEMLKTNYDSKIIIYNPKDNSIKEINLNEPYDFVKPKLTPLGIIAWDRLTTKFYLLKSY